MIEYKYKAISKDGSHVSGMISAYDEYEAAARIKEEYPIIEHLSEARLAGKKEFDLNEPLWINEKNLALLSSQFAILLNAGLPVSRVVSIIAGQTSDALLKKYLAAAAEDVQAGYSLSDSLKNHGKKLPPVFIETIRSGEESGSLERSFAKLKVYFDKRSTVKAKVRSALLYPAALLILAVIVIVIVVNAAVPAISGVIAESGGEMPLPTVILLKIYSFFQSYGLTFLLFSGLLIILFEFWKKYTAAGRAFWAGLVCRLPIIGNLIRMNAASQFASTMSTLLSAGFSAVKAVDITASVIDNYMIARSLQEASVKLDEGRTLGSVLEHNPYLPPLLTEMTAVGESSGSLEETLTTIGAYYDQEAERSSARVLALLEPAITIAMGIAIGYIVIALYLPMFSMYGGM